MSTGTQARPLEHGHLLPFTSAARGARSFVAPRNSVAWLVLGGRATLIWLPVYVLLAQTLAPLHAVFAASVVKLARRAGRGSNVLQVAAVGGGVLSVATLGTSALTSLQLTQGKADDPATAVRLHRRAFLAGGPLHGPAIGLLTGALGLAGLRTNELPRWLSTVSLATAAAGLVAPSAIKTEATVLLIPASRFTGLLLAGVAGATLARRRR